jgi:hypothetical protein
MQILACSYGSSGGSASSGMIGAVPEIQTWRPTRTALEYPTRSSNAAPDEMF